MNNYNNEEVLVVERLKLASNLAGFDHNLITSNIQTMYDLIIKHSFMMLRENAENNSDFKQIIPYAVAKLNDEFFLLKRTKKQAEKRLHDKLSLGIGGHINPIDNDDKINDVIANGLIRELSEEVNISELIQTKLIGFINDETTEVGKVHLGLLFEVELTNKSIEIKEQDHMEGEWKTLNEIYQSYEKLET